MAGEPFKKTNKYQNLNGTRRGEHDCDRRERADSPERLSLHLPDTVDELRKNMSPGCESLNAVEKNLNGRLNTSALFICAAAMAPKRSRTLSKHKRSRHTTKHRTGKQMKAARIGRVFKHIGVNKLGNGGVFYKKHRTSVDECT